MKIAIGFFGITRSLQHTIKSIETNIFDVLKKNAIEFDIFIHTYNLSDYKNVRTGEVVKSENINNEEYKLLNADYVKIDNQESIKQKLKLLQYRSQKDPWNTKYNSVDNFILGQYSKFTLTQMIKNRDFPYDYVLFVRPDCLYYDMLPINVFKYKLNNAIVIPNVHLFGPYKFNDRFCIATQRTYKIYGEVFTKLLDISKKQPLHSETIIGQIMTNNKINIIKTKFNFSRVRSNGLICDKFPPNKKPTTNSHKIAPRKQIIKNAQIIKRAQLIKRAQIIKRVQIMRRARLLRSLALWWRWKKRR